MIHRFESFRGVFMRRASSAAAFWWALLLNTAAAQNAKSVEAQMTGWTATVQVMVRDARGAPIAGLGAGDFDVAERGVHDEVVTVEAFKSSLATGTPDAPRRQGAAGVAAERNGKTAVLVILPPMSATGRHAALGGIRKFLQQPMPRGWSLALLDDAGEFVGFTEDAALLRARVEVLRRRVSPRQSIYGPWMGKACRGVDELSLQPGRHAIVFASDFEFDVAGVGRNPWSLRVGPSSFVDAAVRAGAPVYAIQASGPGTVVPTGFAAESQMTEFGQPFTMSGEMVARSTSMQLAGLSNVQSNYLYAADQTGGWACWDVRDAFARVAADAAGHYRIAFRPSLAEPDGAWHMVSVRVRVPGARVRGPRYYLAPGGFASEYLPPPMTEALKAGREVSEFEGAAHVWVFPQVAGGRTSVMVADFAWPEAGGGLPHSDRVQVFAELVDLITHVAVISWTSEKMWVQEGGQRATTHWQREATLYPGAYSLRVVAMDQGTGKIATRAFAFAVNLSAGAAPRFGEIVMAGRCLREDEYEGRRDLFDPMLHEGCLLAPSASAEFSAKDKPMVMMRMYPSNRTEGEAMLTGWTAWAVIDSGARIPLTIAPASVRGLVVWGRLDVAELRLAPGRHTLQVFLDSGGKRGGMVHSLESELTVRP